MNDKLLRFFDCSERSQRRADQRAAAYHVLKIAYSPDLWSHCSLGHYPAAVYCFSQTLAPFETVFLNLEFNLERLYAPLKRKGGN